MRLVGGAPCGLRVRVLFYIVSVWQVISDQPGECQREACQHHQQSSPSAVSQPLERGLEHWAQSAGHSTITSPASVLLSPLTGRLPATDQKRRIRTHRKAVPGLGGTGRQGNASGAPWGRQERYGGKWRAFRELETNNNISCSTLHLPSGTADQPGGC